MKKQIAITFGLFLIMRIGFAVLDAAIAPLKTRFPQASPDLWTLIAIGASVILTAAVVLVAIRISSRVRKE